MSDCLALIISLLHYNQHVHSKAELPTLPFSPGFSRFLIHLPPPSRFVISPGNLPYFTRYKCILLIIKSKCFSNVLQLPDHVWNTIVSYTINTLYHFQPICQCGNLHPSAQLIFLRRILTREVESERKGEMAEADAGVHMFVNLSLVGQRSFHAYRTVIFLT